MRVVTSEQMKAVEAAALNFDLTEHRLMENAGSAAAAFIRRTFNVDGLNCMIFCGRGNNGGDGFVVARKLFEHDANVLIVMVGGMPRSEQAASMYNSAELMGIPIASYEQNRERIFEIMGEADIIVDAIYGTGFHDSLNLPVRDLCAAINAAIAAIVSLDVPSGVNADTGAADPDAIRADFCIAFDSYKPLHIHSNAASFCGIIELVDIGIPPEAHEGIVSVYRDLDTPSVFALLPERNPMAHKGDHGKVLAICGSARYRGAAALAAMGALRCGAGLVTLAACETVCQAVAAHLLEPVYLPLAENCPPETLTPAIHDATAILFGCGLGTDGNIIPLLTHVLQEAQAPVIIDADGINALSRNIHILQEAKPPVILTPHPGEMARLTALPVAEIQGDRIGTAHRFAREFGVIVVLKGHETVIATPDGEAMINHTGNAGLAKGGSGDILAGMIAAFAAQGLALKDAAACAVHLHGLAADRTAQRRSQYGMLPSELLDDLTAIFAEGER